MAEFLHDDDLNAAIGRIFRESEQQLVIISPFIKLHSRLKDALKSKSNPHKLNIVVVFGKNENKIEKSLSKEEFDFLREFPNITIKYQPRLHAKYYANERSAILSSMNLYDFSQNNNIEFGILTESSIFGDISSNFTGITLDKDAHNYFQEVISNSDTVFSNKPVYKEGGFMSKLVKSYTHFENEVDELSDLLLKTVNRSPKKETLLRQNLKSSGFCIRTGVEIPFNLEKPLSDKAFQQWNRFKDKDYNEKYCHFSGEPSNGETSVAKPILRKNWKKSQN